MEVVSFSETYYLFVYVGEKCLQNGVHECKMNIVLVDKVSECLLPLPPLPPLFCYDGVIGEVQWQFHKKDIYSSYDLEMIDFRLRLHLPLADELIPQSYGCRNGELFVTFKNSV